MSETKLGELLDAMPNIAKVVNTFTSDAVQQKAFAILMNALGAEDVDEQAEETRSQARAKGTAKRAAPKEKSGKPRKTPVGPPRLRADLNLRPKGKKSLRDFIGEKKPQTNEERFAVIIFYLEKELKEKGVDRDHVYTAFKELGVRAPVDIDAAIRMAASRKGWINNSDTADLKMTVHGENFVEHDLPATDGAKK